MHKYHTVHRAFTIVELLVVIVVIGILAAISVVAYNGIQNRAKDTAREVTVKQVIDKARVAQVLKGQLSPSSGGWWGVSTSELREYYDVASLGDSILAPIDADGDPDKNIVYDLAGRQDGALTVIIYRWSYAENSWRFTRLVDYNGTQYTEEGEGEPQIGEPEIGFL